jgi:hypothetical protein
MAVHLVGECIVDRYFTSASSPNHVVVMDGQFNTSEFDLPTAHKYTICEDRPYTVI